MLGKQNMQGPLMTVCGFYTHIITTLHQQKIIHSNLFKVIAWTVNEVVEKVQNIQEKTHAFGWYACTYVVNTVYI